VTVNGATNNIAHSGTITLGADGFEFAPTNNRQWTQNGVIAIGANSQTWLLSNTQGIASSGIYLSAAGSLTGTGNLAFSNNSGIADWQYAYAYLQQANAGYSGTITLNANVGLVIGAAGSLTAANFAVSGNGSILSPAASGQTLGAAGKTLTINNDCQLSYVSRSFTIAPNVVLAGTGTRTLTVAGNTTMSGTVTGTAGVTVAGSSKYIALSLDNVTTSGLTGPCTVSSGSLLVRRATAPYVPSTLSIAADARFFYYGSTSDYTFDVTPTGLGTLLVTGIFDGDGVTFPASPTVGNIAEFAGCVGMRPNTGINNTCKLRLSELPGSLGWFGFADGATAYSASITYTGSGQTKSTALIIDSENNTNLSTLTASTYSLLSSGSGPIVLSGTVQRTNDSATASARMNLTLGGSNTGDNTLSGNISEVGSNSAILGLTKVDAGRWVLSGANSSHTGIHTVSAGTLSAQSAKALGSATSAGGVTISGTGVLELAGGITLDKSSTAFTIHQTSPITSVGDNTVQTAGITLGGTTTFEVTTGNRLAISNSGAITDGASTFGLTKTGAGELALAAFANTYDGAVTVTAGTLAIGSVGALGTGVATVQLTGNLKYTGTGETLSRATLLNGSAPSFEASGSGALTVSNLSTSVSTKTLTLKGSSTGANTITSSLTDNSGVLSLAKEDAGKWVVTSRTYSGTTAVNAGTLRCESTNSATTSGAVTIGASGTVELVTNTLASSGAGNGEVLGTGNVTVNGGTIKTRGGTTQKGQVRYGGNLTFGAGSSLYIGAAA
jgi:autotransporter-associated beta strand protein